MLPDTKSSGPSKVHQFCSVSLKCCFSSFRIGCGTFLFTANLWPDLFHTNCCCQALQLTFTSMWWPSRPEIHLFMAIVAQQPFRYWNMATLAVFLTDAVPPTLCQLTTPFIFLKGGGGCWFYEEMAQFVDGSFLHSPRERCRVKSSVSAGFWVCHDNPEWPRSLQMFLTPWWLFTAQKALRDLTVSRLLSQSLSQAHYSAAWRSSFIAFC